MMDDNERNRKGSLAVTIQALSIIIIKVAVQGPDFMAHPSTIQTDIREVRGSNLGRNTDSPAFLGPARQISALYFR